MFKELRAVVTAFGDDILIAAEHFYGNCQVYVDPRCVALTASGSTASNSPASNSGDDVVIELRAARTGSPFAFIKDLAVYRSSDGKQIGTAWREDLAPFLGAVGSSEARAAVDYVRLFIRNEFLSGFREQVGAESAAS